MSPSEARPTNERANEANRRTAASYWTNSILRVTSFCCSFEILWRLSPDRHCAPAILSLATAAAADCDLQLKRTSSLRVSLVTIPSFLFTPPD
jgi:hypothetical protein